MKSGFRGVINRDAEGLPLADNKRARQALHLAIDRDRLLREVMSGRSRSPALRPRRHHPPTQVPKSPLALWARPSPRSRVLARSEGTGPAGRPLRVAALGDRMERGPQRVTTDLGETLGVEARVTVLPWRGGGTRPTPLGGEGAPREWDVFILEQTAQTADAPPLELNRAFVRATGEYQVSPVLPKFEAL